MTKLRAQWIGAFFLLAGCPDDGGGGDTVGPVPSEEAPETAVSVICGAFDGCSCDPAGMAPEGCDVRIDDQIRQAQGDAVAAGLTYDADCMGRLLTLVRELDCQQFSDFTLEEIVELGRRYECKVFYGTATAGQACESLPDLGDSCARDVSCVDGLCVASPEIAAEGEPCENQGDFLNACVAGTYCIDVDGDNQPRCLRLPEAGDSCLGSLQYCNAGLACVDGTCTLAPGEGEPCHDGFGDSCAEDLVCDLANNTCVRAPAGGEECLFSCISGFQCIEGRCVEEEAIVCDIELYDVDPQG